MKRADVLPMPFMSAWDPRAPASGSIEPPGALRPFTAVVTTLLGFWSRSAQECVCRVPIRYPWFDSYCQICEYLYSLHPYGED